jgi:nucleolin
MAKKDTVDLSDEDEQTSDDPPAKEITEEGEGDDNELASGKRKRKRKRKKKDSAQDADDEIVKDEVEEGGDDTRNMVEHTAYVEGIPFHATPDQVKEFFVKAGIDDVVELRLPTWQDSGRLRGYGHILFESTASYEKALKLSGQNLGKRYLTIQAANTPRNNEARVTPMQQQSKEPPPSDCRTLFVNNLPYHASEDEISQVVQKLGVTIPDDGVRIARNSVTRQSKGFCYIDFETHEDAKKVMDNGHRLTVNGRLVRLDWDTGRIKGSYRADSGRLWSREIKEKKKAGVGH